MRFGTAALAAASVVLALAGPASAASVSDHDGDKVFDDLERRLAAKAANAPVDVIVTLRVPATSERVGEITGDVGGVGNLRRLSLIDGFAAQATKEDVLALARMPEVAHVEANLPVHAFNNSAQESFGVAKARLDADVDGDGDGSPTTYSRDDLVAAVVDTGIDTSHVDLDGGKVLAFVNCASKPCTPVAPSDVEGHGTHVAATIAGDGEARADRLYRGVAPAAALVGVRILDSNGKGTLADVVTGLQWVVANRTTYGIEAVNLSLGTPGCHPGTDAASTAVNNAVAAGLLVVAAAGNAGPGACTIGIPSAAASAITVGAMADVGERGFRLAAFSSRGPTADGRMKPDIVGPGVGITSASRNTGTGYATYSGTSMSAPFVAGVALLMLDANPALSAAEVKSHMSSSAVDWGAAGSDGESGAGRLDGYAAIRAAGALISAPPVAPRHLLLTGTLTSLGASQDFPLTVSEPGFPLAVTLVAPGWVSSAQSPNFDLALLDAAGNVLASGATASDPNSTDVRRHEEVVLPSVSNGAYTLRVTSAGGAGPFVADVSGASAGPPATSVGPSIAGIAEEGATLTATIGTWAATAPLAFAHQWRRCDAAGNGCADIGGATGSTHVLGAADIGATLRVAVTATDIVGSTTAVSAATPLVARRPDREAPIVRTLASSGPRGRLVKLLYRVTEASGRTSETVRVFRAGRVIRTLSTRLSTRVSGRTYYVLWRAPRTREAAARLRFCVRAWDAARNRSAASCAPLRVR